MHDAVCLELVTQLTKINDHQNDALLSSFVFGDSLWAKPCVLISSPCPSQHMELPVSALPPPWAQPPPSEVPDDGLPMSRHRNQKGSPLPAPPCTGHTDLWFYTVGAHLPGETSPSPMEKRDSGPHITLNSGPSWATRVASMFSQPQDTGSADMMSRWLEKCSDTKFHSTPDVTRAKISPFPPDLQLNIQHLTDLRFLIAKGANELKILASLKI